MLCAQALVSFLTRLVAMYATVSWPKAPQAYALAPKNVNKAREECIFGEDRGDWRIEAGQRQVGDSSFISNVAVLTTLLSRRGLLLSSQSGLPIGDVRRSRCVSTRGGKPLNPDRLGCMRQVVDTAVQRYCSRASRVRNSIFRLPTCQVLSHVPVR
jgi:hypothetical protein